MERGVQGRQFANEARRVAAKLANLVPLSPTLPRKGGGSAGVDGVPSIELQQLVPLPLLPLHFANPMRRIAQVMMTVRRMMTRKAMAAV